MNFLKLANKFIDKHGHRWALDLRALAVFRMGLGAIVFIDSFLLMFEAKAFYSDIGVISRQDIRLFSGIWSLNFIDGSVFFQKFLLGSLMVSSLGLFFGWKTKIMTVITWALACSIDGRNYLVLSGADNYRRVLLFWAMFLPLNRFASLDYRNQPIINPRFVSWAGIALLVQVAIVYSFNAYYKSGTEWFPDGTAGYLTLHLERSLCR